MGSAGSLSVFFDKNGPCIGNLLELRLPNCEGKSDKDIVKL